MSNYNIYHGGIVPIKAWNKGVVVDPNAADDLKEIEEQALQQLRNIALLPFVHKHVAVMPDVHMGKGATVGSVIATKKAIIPAAVGVDIGCGMMAVKTSLDASQLPDNLGRIRSAIEKAVPHGRTDHGGRNDRGAWGHAPKEVERIWKKILEPDFLKILEKYPKFEHKGRVKQLGTLGTGNHFIEVCLDEEDKVWFMLHSGSRGTGNLIGTIFTKIAKKEMERFYVRLPDADLAYLPQGTEYHDDYVTAVEWAQNYALWNRKIMMENLITGLKKSQQLPQFTTDKQVINCHHNYVAIEHHFGENVFVTRKGAVRAREGDLGIIPGSMGAKSFIVEGKGNPESFCSCSHGAGRKMSRNKAKNTFSLDDHIEATKHVECRKDEEVIDETPGAYKDIDAVMNAQSDLVEVKHTLRQIVCVKG